ncbi:MAG TPA: alpha/beta hydrolase-fold protein [Gaiellaceae bacterium]|nr:alpha/beta hydrolase-fold protein [Gaiellaceae bacterium]
MRALTVLAALLALAAGAAPRGDAARAGLPASWTAGSGGPDGGVVYQGRIPNRFVPSDRRFSAVYLPPRYDPAKRYPVVYLLHGMPGRPTSIWGGLHLAQVADGLIASGLMKPFIAVLPVAGPTVHPGAGEWAGVWENYLVQDVVPWVDAHLSTLRGPQGRALEGLCAGGFGAVDIGLRHPGVFGTLGSWEGYFAPVFRDGPFRHAGAGVLRAHDPALLVRRDAASLRRSGVRFYVSVGGNHGDVLRSWSIAFARELTRLRLLHELWTLPPIDRGHFWGATLPSALLYADGRT